MFRCSKCHVTGMDITKQGTATVLLRELESLQAEHSRIFLQTSECSVLGICIVTYTHC
jgi:hypothetical protein